MNEADKKAFEAALPEIFGPPISIIYEQYNTHIAAQPQFKRCAYCKGNCGETN